MVATRNRRSLSRLGRSCLAAAGVFLSALKLAGGDGTETATGSGEPAPFLLTGPIKAEDIARARENLRHYDWARKYLRSLEDQTSSWLPALTPEFLENMLPATTPGSTIFTPCPACRAAGRAYHPQGDWSWSPRKPDEQTCNACNTVFPNEAHPESVVLQSTWGTPQRFSYIGGEPFSIFGYTGRPSISGNIRARKTAWTSSLAGDLGELHALTGKTAYARAVRAILLRLASVYPHWLVHNGYGEVIDLAPKVAAANISHWGANPLPGSRPVLAPAKPPGNKFHVGFWAAGRGTASGQEGLWLAPLIKAYDLTRHAADEQGAPIYGPEERERIERDLLRESTWLLVSDKDINNKSLGNRSAAALAGLALADPGLVRFGIDGFTAMVDDWFLPDGSTPESPAYAIMTLRGVELLALALRGYSDPPGYRDAQGKRLDRFDPWRDTAYERVWASMFATIQGDLRYPPFADSYVRSSLDTRSVELMVLGYPENPAYQSLLAARMAGQWDNVYAPYALYYARKGRERAPVGPLVLPSHCPPDLRIGFMRGGPTGRDSLLTLSASHWGAHHHLDSLNLYYWKNGRELLSDLGYLWDHPEKRKTERTLAHNTLLVDERDQESRTRGGEVRSFVNHPKVKAMLAASKAYPAMKTYARTSLLVDHGEGRDYVVDVFWAHGGRTQDYVYHLGGGELSLPLPTVSGGAKLYDLTNLRTAQSGKDRTWRLQEKRGPDFVFSAWNLSPRQETVHIGDGWGQRDHTNKDRGKTLPYVVRRRPGGGAPQSFVSVFEGHAPGREFVRDLRLLPLESAAGQALGLTVTTATGEDHFVLSPTRQRLRARLPDGRLESEASITVVSLQKGQVAFSVTDAEPARLR